MILVKIQVQCSSRKAPLNMSTIKCWNYGAPLLTISTHGFGWKFMSPSNLTHTKLKKDHFFNIRQILGLWYFVKKKRNH
ncbi:hypothetical protein HanPI659440_Chr17g0685111 [Helianthus annuus]|nr:hypothetical protein HanPI659440_Chr17g0685111 [Helianthus annuus]